MKQFIKLSFLILMPVFAKAQKSQKDLDSLHFALKNAANDTTRMVVYENLGWYYQMINYDSVHFYADRELQLARQLNQKLDEAQALTLLSEAFTGKEDYPKSLECLMQALHIVQDPASEKNTRRLPLGYTPGNYRLAIIGKNHLYMGYLYDQTGNINKEISILQEAIKLADSTHYTSLQGWASGDLGSAYIKLNKLDSALLLLQKALVILSKQRDYFEGLQLNRIGEIYFRKGDINLSREAWFKAARIGEERTNLWTLGPSYISLGKLYLSGKKTDSSLLFANKALETYQRLKDPSGIATAASLISLIYSDQNKNDSSFAYLKLATALKDSLHLAKINKLNEFQNIGFEEQMRLKELEAEKIQTQNKIRTYTMWAGIGVFMLITFLLYRNTRTRKKANELLLNKNVEIEQQKMELEQTLRELKSTQAQLIQSEKMASLGELTAGIAHEIQNPLNFVNNFSEVSTELLDEMIIELGNDSKANAIAIAGDVKQNLEKILQHGKQADGIVKGMLQHSRNSSAVKEPTNINKLTDEYLRLAYHGFRAKDKSFNAVLKTDFDESISDINIIAQDIGRVILNLINNAFYAVAEKKKQVGEDYEPIITVSTERVGSSLRNEDKIEIRVADNGNGVPQKVVDKIFQPFFTTKPTGSGTGLGLSLSYDIINAHGGEIKVKTVGGEGAEFIITLPIN